MTAKSAAETDLLTGVQPDAGAIVNAWVDWYWASFLPAWIVRARDAETVGFCDHLDNLGQPAQTDRRTVLAQARLLFSFSHLALFSENPAFDEAARIARNALKVFRKKPGAYCRARTARGQPTGTPQDDLAASYDQSFVILGLSTWSRLHPEEDVNAELEHCWSYIETHLRDPATGLLLEHDGLSDPAADDAPRRAQNPHMHLYEAALQAFEMTGQEIWMVRAQEMRRKGLDYFFDRKSGTLMEFIAPDLARLPGREGQRREIGHQCEWAWLLLREVELGGDPMIKNVAESLLMFADRYGFQDDGIMTFAAFDSVSADATWKEATFLLWPQTEAIKAYALRAEAPTYFERTQTLGLLMFQRFFAGRAGFVNQLDQDGAPLWDEALSRLHYHIVLALTEGARAGVWNYPK
ncbi:MAG: AGE family epimerase/isomerase [Roseobacter sp.]